MKRRLLVLLLVGLLASMVTGYAVGSPNRVATVSLGKRFSPDEVGSVLDPVLMGLGLQRLSEKAQNRAIGTSEMSWYGALGYMQGSPSLYYEGSGSLSILIFADRSMSCLRISVTDMTQPPDQRAIPTISAIIAALSKQYGSALKHYSDLQCLHAL
jgi:hypothetical protein